MKAIQDSWNNLKRRVKYDSPAFLSPFISCIRFGESSTDVVPFHLHTSTLLTDKLVEVPRELELENQQSVKKQATTPRENIEMRHDQVLRRHRSRGPEPPRVVEWLEMRDPVSQKIYYHNKVTGKSVWNKPDGFDEAIELSTQIAEPEESFWIEVQDSKGRTYYYDLLTRETRWDRPLDYEEMLVKD